MSRAVIFLVIAAAVVLGITFVIYKYLHDREQSRREKERQRHERDMLMEEELFGEDEIDMELEAELREDDHE